MRQITPNKQKGAALIITLLILLVLTVIGVSSMSRSSLEEKMAANAQDRQLAFQSAEAALAHAENYILQFIVSQGAFATANDHLYPLGSGPTNFNANDVSAWWTGTASAEYPTTIQGVNTKPRYTIEYRGEIGEEDLAGNINIGNYGTGTGGGMVQAFRVTAYGKGKSANSVVILVSNYGKRI